MKGGPKSSLRPFLKATVVNFLIKFFKITTVSVGHFKVIKFV